MGRTVAGSLRGLVGRRGSPWPGLRRTSQGLWLALFVFLGLAAVFPLWSPVPVDLFLRLDPLIALSASLGNRQLSLHFLWALPLVFGTIVLGRFFCGWMCPLGTILDTVRTNRDQRAIGSERRWRSVKIYLLGLILASALAGSLTLMLADPTSLTMRTFAVVAAPTLNLALTLLLRTLYDLGVAADLMVAVDQSVRQSLFPYQPQAFQLAFIFLLVFLGIALANLVTHRFWCRYLCPLGAMLSLLSRAAPFRRRVADGCNSCNRCTRNCRMGAIDEGGRGIKAGECVACAECVGICPQRVTGFGWGIPQPAYDPSRRQALTVLGLGLLGTAGLRVDGAPVERGANVVRPPGAQHASFLQRCARCGACIKVCPTGALQSALFEAGLDGIFSPILIGESGYCEWNCNSCGQVCPTGAIEFLPLEVKRKTFIGTAYIDRSRCIPWVDNVECIVCEEVCPLPRKAVILEPATVAGDDGLDKVVRRPRVLREICTGCAICQYKCPVPRPAAIQVLGIVRDPRQTG